MGKIFLIQFHLMLKSAPFAKLKSKSESKNGDVPVFLYLYSRRESIVENKHTHTTHTHTHTHTHKPRHLAWHLIDFPPVFYLHCEAVILLVDVKQEKSDASGVFIKASVNGVDFS